MGSEAEGAGAEAAGRRWRFGDAVFDGRALKLYVRGRAVDLEMKPLEVLRYLLQRAGEAVSKDDLIKTVWPGRVISDSALTSTIAKLRDALHDDGATLKTVHGFGYRLEADVRTSAADAPPGDAAGEAAPSRRLVAVMFTDLVGYSALAHRDEALAIELLELHRGWVREILPHHGGREIETVGDAFLVEFAGALAALECAVAIQRRFAGHNQAVPADRRMELRIGIHLGDVEHRGDKLMGDGVNIASRIHGMAEPGGICLSESVYQAVRNRGGFAFESLGRPKLKNIATPLELYKVTGGAAPSSAAVPDGQWQGRRLRLAAAAAIGVIGVIGLVLWNGYSAGPRATPSVAVLPFANLSSEKDNEYFADGVHDAILALLARVGDLKVISRTSVMEYRAQTRNLRDIGRALDVAHIVEGSVQRAGGRVRITAQLIEAASDRHLWAETYDRELADIFGIQSEVAERIAAAIEARLTPEEKSQIQRAPTSSAEAYDLYLRGEEAFNQLDGLRAGVIVDAELLLERAVALDPGFALAHAALARNHILLYWFGHDSSAQRREQSRIAADTALRLQPGLAEGYFARGLYHYYGFRDYDRALAEFDRALARSPNSAVIHEFVGYVQRRRGLWQEALAAGERAIALDPRSPVLYIEHGLTHLYLRRFAEADAAYRKVEALSPGSAAPRILRAWAEFLRRGDLGPLRAALAGAGKGPGGTGESAVSLALYEGRHADAIAQLRALPQTVLSLAWTEFKAPKEFFLGTAHFAKGDATAARPYFQRARERLTDFITENPDGIFLAHANALLGLTSAYLGERQEAVQYADLARRLLPVSRDALDGAQLELVAAATHLHVGDRDRALAGLRRLLELPAGAYAHDLQADPQWTPLRNDPRFRKLVAEHLPKS